MGKQKLNIKDIHTIEFPSEVARSLGLNIMNRHFKHIPNDEKIQLLKDVLQEPERFKAHDTLGILAYKLTGPPLTQVSYEVFDLLDSPRAFEVFGNRHIEQGAIHQMAVAMRLPVAKHGALMPDAHPGYGLPIGGVLATENAVIPYGVGMDIGCRMALSILDLPGSYVEHNTYALKKALQEHTHFGNEGGLDEPQDHEVLEHPDFKLTELLRKQHGKAVYQLGSSGSGNHFVEFGIVELAEGNTFGLPGANYAAILSHSGSRSLGANIAQHYTRVAMAKCKLPGEAKSLAWLDMSSEEGQEYWLSMNLAGEYAKASHDRIHHNLRRALGVKTLYTVENHHNFAWQETLDDGREYIVHRKGATPAASGVYGIIPGSMIAPGYIVRGLGNSLALNSAAHGAGRKLSRLKSRETTTMSALKKQLQAEKVTLIGGSTEEGPHAYKDIDLVMKSQGTLVAVEGTFMPKVVRMAKD
jgi:tRNA-splicing ligase RtcB